MAFVQAFIGAIVLWVVFFFSKKENARPKDILLLLFTRSSIGISTYLYYLSVQYIPASIAIVLLIQFTWISILIEWIVFRKKPLLYEFLITIIILFGTILASGLTSQKEVTLPLKGVGLVFLAYLIYTVYIVLNSRIGKNLNWQNKSSWIMTGSALSIFIVNFQPMIFENHFGSDLLKWGLFLALFGTILPPVFLQLVYQK